MLGDDHVRFHRLKDALSKFDDAFFDNLAKTVNGIAQEKRTLRRIFAERADASPDAPAGGGEVFRVSACAGSTVPTTARERQSGSATVSDPNCFTAETQRSQRLA